MHCVWISIRYNIYIVYLANKLSFPKLSSRKLSSLSRIRQGLRNTRKTTCIKIYQGPPRTLPYVWVTKLYLLVSFVLFQIFQLYLYIIILPKNLTNYETNYKHSWKSRAERTYYLTQINVLFWKFLTFRLKVR